MLLPRAIFFVTLVYFTQELRLFKRAIEDAATTIEKATDHVPEKVTDATSVISKNDISQVHSENVDLEVISEAQRDAHKSESDVNNVRTASENAPEDASNKSKKEVDSVYSGPEVTEHAGQPGNSEAEERVDNVSEHAVNINKWEGDHVNSESRSTLESVAQSKRASVNIGAASEKSNVNADAVSEKSAVNTDAVSEKSALNDESVFENANQAAAAPGGPHTLDLPVNGRRSNQQWCQNLKNCHPNKIEICGYDEKAGFAKFKDFCHLMEVNCHWDHNFTLHTCKAMQLKQMGRPRHDFNK